MATPIYSTSFIRSHGGAGGSYEVPEGMVAIIRCVTALNMGLGDPENAQVYLGHSSCTIFATTLSPFLPSSPGWYLIENFRVVVEATDTINVLNGANVDMTVNGYLLTA